jgi:uncharacterized protein (TIGR00730 family)
MKSVCVYCGSANQASQKYFRAANQMGVTLARRGLTLIYGGGKTGLMGALADAVVDNGGEVIGVIVESMNTPELAHTRLTHLEVTATIHQRKSRMYELATGMFPPGGTWMSFQTLTRRRSANGKPVGC